jgi:hypothetical protein
MNSDILKRMRDALQTAAGQYGPITDEQRNEWLALTQEYDASDWFVTSTIADTGDPADGSMGDDSA